MHNFKWSLLPRTYSEIVCVCVRVRDYESLYTHVVRIFFCCLFASHRTAQTPSKLALVNCIFVNCNNIAMCFDLVCTLCCQQNLICSPFLSLFSLILMSKMLFTVLRSCQIYLLLFNSSTTSITD